MQRSRATHTHTHAHTTHTRTHTHTHTPARIRDAVSAAVTLCDACRALGVRVSSTEICEAGAWQNGLLSELSAKGVSICTFVLVKQGKLTRERPRNSKTSYFVLVKQVNWCLAPEESCEDALGSRRRKKSVFVTLRRSFTKHAL